MFADFANLWTIIGLARDIKPNALWPVMVAGERLVLFRDGAGKLCGLVDRCPHRGVALSLGTMKDGVIECPFHGWQFDGTGRNCHVPWNPDAKKDQLGATPLIVRESSGLVWLYTGFAPPDEPTLPEVFLQDDVVVCAQTMVWSVHWTRVMENMLDTPHLPYVHKATIGKALSRSNGQRMEMHWTPQPYGGDIRGEVDGQFRGAGLIYRFPNVMELIIDPPKRVFRLLAVCTPENVATARLTIYTVRSFARTRLLDPVFKYYNSRVACEDRRIVESSLPSEVLPAAAERSVRTDKPTLMFRKIYFDRIKGSEATPKFR